MILKDDQIDLPPPVVTNVNSQIITDQMLPKFILQGIGLSNTTALISPSFYRAINGEPSTFRHLQINNAAVTVNNNY